MDPPWSSSTELPFTPPSASSARLGQKVSLQLVAATLCPLLLRHDRWPHRSDVAEKVRRLGLA
jgi:hypothetical protein